MLMRKMLRTIGHYRAQFISMVVMVALGISVFVGFNIEWFSIETDVNAFLDKTGFADYRVVSEDGFTQTDLDNIADIEGVTEAARYLSFNGSEKESNHLMGVVVTTNPKVSSFVVMDGSDYDENSEDGFWIMDKYAEKNNIEVGDTYTLTYEKYEFTGKIKGIIEAGEQLICLQDENQLMPDFDTYGYVYISPKFLESVVATAINEEYSEYGDDMADAKVENGDYTYLEQAMNKLYYQINVRTDLTKSEFTKKLEKAMGKTLEVITKDETVSYSEAMGEADEGKATSSLLPVLFFLIAILIMITTMQRITTNEKIQIGTLKALGFKDRKIALHYTAFAFFIALLGSILGTAIGYLIGRLVMNPSGMMGTYIVMDDWTLVAPWWTWLVLAGMICLMTFIGFITTKQILRGNAANTLRPYVPKVKPMLIESTPIWKHMGFANRWNMRDAMRHKLRSLVTFIGIMGCMVIMVASLGMYDTMNKYLDLNYNKVMNYKTKVCVSDDMGNEETVKLAEKLDGDYSATLSVQIEDQAVALEVYNVSHGYVNFLDEDNNVEKLPENGALVSLRIMDKYDLQTGDTIEVSPFTTDDTYKIKVVGVARSMSESIVISEDYAETLECQNTKLVDTEVYKVGNVYTNVDKENVSGKDISTVQSKQEIEDTFDSFMTIMYTMIWVLIVVGMVLSLVVLYNLGVMSYIERYRELATLKVVGFKNKKISSILISQNIWLTVIGIILGIPSGVYVLEWLMKLLASEYEVKVFVGVLGYTVGPVVTIIVSLFVGILLSKKNKKINMVEALKGIE